MAFKTLECDHLRRRRERVAPLTMRLSNASSQSKKEDREIRVDFALACAHATPPSCHLKISIQQNKVGQKAWQCEV